MTLVTWRKLIQEEADRHGDRVEDMTVSIEEGGLDREFWDDYGPQGAPFTAWSKDRVYFPIWRHDYETVGSVPRNPSEEKTGHAGL